MEMFKSPEDLIEREPLQNSQPTCESDESRANAVQRNLDIMQRKVKKIYIH